MMNDSFLDKSLNTDIPVPFLEDTLSTLKRTLAEINIANH